MSYAPDQTRPLYGEQTALTVKNMSFSGRILGGFPGYVAMGARVKHAAALANHAAGYLTEDKAVKIARACDRIAAGEYLAQFPVDVFHGGGGIGINMNFNEVLAALAGSPVSAVDDVNMSQSTSDFCHTTLRAALVVALRDLAERTGHIIHTARDRATAFAGTKTIARTCWQDGLSVDASALPQALASALDRTQKRLVAMAESLLAVNMGWTVIGSGAGAPDAYRDHILRCLRETTGLDLHWRDYPYDAAQYPDDLAAASSAVRSLSAVLAKSARDLRILSSGPECGLGELSLPAVQAGSSFFPGKVNPVIPEMVIHCDMLVAGNDSIIQGIPGMGEMHINLWEVTAGFLLLDNIRMLSQAMERYDALCLAGVTVNCSHCESHAVSRIPFVVECKERLGYECVSNRIKQEGLDAFIRSEKENTERK
ncbi:MAG: hypothetical protein LUC93_09525 [Planctomycetaceae bacterium]|nr:hypothetical protein [Planctomycetaceae bacterium]